MEQNRIDGGGVKQEYKNTTEQNIKIEQNIQLIGLTLRPFPEQHSK